MLRRGRGVRGVGVGRIRGERKMRGRRRRIAEGERDDGFDDDAIHP